MSKLDRRSHYSLDIDTPLHLSLPPAFPASRVANGRQFFFDQAHPLLLVHATPFPKTGVPLSRAPTPLSFPKQYYFFAEKWKIFERTQIQLLQLLRGSSECPSARDTEPSPFAILSLSPLPSIQSAKWVCAFATSFPSCLSTPLSLWVHALLGMALTLTLSS